MNQQANQAGTQAREPAPHHMPAWLAKPVGPLISLILFFLIVLLPSMLIPSPPSKVPFDANPLQRLQEHKPEYILVGNSMPRSRIILGLLSRLAGNRPVESVFLNGSRSEVWYLMFKNYVVAAGIKPKAVFLFFRNYVITQPRRGSGAVPYRRVYERMMPGPDPLFQKIVFAHRGWELRCLNWLAWLFPIENHHFNVNRQLYARAMAMSGVLWLPDGNYRRWIRWRHMLNRRFGLDHLRQDLQDFQEAREEGFFNPRGYFTWLTEEDGRMDFTKSLELSFLPHLIDLARENNIKLVLVRVQRRPKANGQLSTSRHLEGYIQALQEYLAHKGVPYYDMHGHPALTLDMYGNGDHIADEKMSAYTELFFHRLREQFQ